MLYFGPTYLLNAVSDETVGTPVAINTNSAKNMFFYADNWGESAGTIVTVESSWDGASWCQLTYNGAAIAISANTELRMPEVRAGQYFRASLLSPATGTSNVTVAMI